jgi:ribonuclease Y
LQHSREMAFIAESIAKDLWVDTYAVRVWALLHDIWKALDHDIEWNHPEIWARVARKYGISEDIVDMIENHHGEPTMISLNSAIIQVADTISSVRPWARRESIELYLKRIKELETLVQTFSWVNNAYAVSAWREVRVFVDAEVISDIEAVKMARDIADKIQENGSYPWEVKVNLIREIRVIEYAK